MTASDTALIEALKSCAIAGSSGEMMNESAPMTKTLKNNPTTMVRFLRSKCDGSDVGVGKNEPCCRAADDVSDNDGDGSDWFGDDVADGAFVEAVVDGDGGNGSGDDVADGVNDVDDTAFGNNGDDGVDEAEGGVERGEPMM
ncbi:MAG: hypothetical protein LKG16_03700 [Bifidobacterium subtile]|nr:hypothetical protein [Bifidobacterium subtile]MCI1258319.1 hypothetical protein [Bifidobacterium subtile]